MKKHVFCRHNSEFEIQFFDVDSMEIMWHGHYVKYLEMARCQFLEEIGYTYDVMKRQGFGWPIVQLNIKYVNPALFRQKIRIELKVVEFESCLRIDYVIFDALSGKKLTIASTTQVAVKIENKEMQLQTPPCWQSAVKNHRTFVAEDTFVAKGDA